MVFKREISGEKNNALAHTHKHKIDKKEKLTQNYDNNWAMMENVQYETDLFSRFKTISFQYACVFFYFHLLVVLFVIRLMCTRCFHLCSLIILVDHRFLNYLPDVDDCNSFSVVVVLLFRVYSSFE